MAEKDIYIKNYVYPKTEDLFGCSLKPIQEIKDDCHFVVDTNALLVPYTVSNKSLTEIEKIYKKLINEKRFYIPGQVAREFVNRRPDKVKQIHECLRRKQGRTNDIFGTKTNFPLLTPLEGQTELLKLEKEISDKLKEYNKHLTNVVRQVKEWTWNDPISLIYKDIFKKEFIEDIEITDAIKKDFEKRREHNIFYPGYKDGGKDDKGIGDYLIWCTILELGKKNKKSIIFVSGEEKPDWWYRSEKEKLYPRFELIHEYERECQNSFHIIKLSELLEMFGAEQEVIDDVRQEEKPEEKLIADNSDRTIPDQAEGSDAKSG